MRKVQERQIEVAEVRMLKLSLGVKSKDNIINEYTYQRSIDSGQD